MNSLAALRPLAQPQFAKLWTAQLLSLVAQNLLNFALIIRVHDLAAGTPYANLAVGSVVASFGTSAVLFAPIAGALVDHWDRRWVMFASNALRAILVIGFFAVGDNLPLILLLTFLISTVTQFFTPAEAAAIPRLVERSDLPAANGIFITTFYASFVVGYAGAAPLIGRFGVSATIATVATCFALAAVVVRLINKLPVAQAEHLTWRSAWRLPGRELMANWRLVISERALRLPIAQLSVVQGVLGSVLALAPALSLVLLGAELEVGGHVLVVPAGIGLVVGVLILGRARLMRSKSRILKLSVMTIGAALLLLAGAHYVPVSPAVTVAVASFLLGTATAAASVTGQTMLQEASTDRNRGKVFGALQMLINLAQTVPVFAAAGLADRLGVTGVVTAIGLVTIVIAAVSRPAKDQVLTEPV